MDAVRRFGVVATTLDAPVRGDIRFRPKTLLVCGADGVFESVLAPGDDSYRDVAERLDQSGDLHSLGSDTIVVPGMVDLHVHAPQWPQLGKALDVPLETWLHRYTFPLEAKYSDLDFADAVYRSLVSGLLANGTTTAVYFATIHQAATQRLAELCLELGQRAVVGKVAMDLHDACPDYYRDESAASAVAATATLIEFVRDHQANAMERVLPAVTPRFIPSCSDALLAGLGELAAAESCLVQTHCSESDWAHQYGLERFGRTDTTSYDGFGLLRRGTVLAHSNFIDRSDMSRIAARGAAVAHCPLSNAFFANSVFPARRALELGVNVGLGTDIAGGSSASLFATAAAAVAVSRIREDGVDPDVAAADRGVPDSRLSFAEAFWMATNGGGRALNLPIGLIETGYRFDLVALNMRAAASSLRVWPDLDSPLDILQKTINNTEAVNVERVWVDGRLVVGVL